MSARVGTYVDRNRGTQPLSVVLRDSFTLEVRRHYYVPEPGEPERDYTLDMYFFFPRSFGAIPSQWVDGAFYTSARAMLRVHAPGLNLERLADLNNRENPAYQLRERLNGFLRTDTASKSKELTVLAQVYGAELTDALAHEAQHLRKRVQAYKRHDGAALRHAMRAYCKHGLEALQAVRRVRNEARCYAGVIHPKLLPALAFAEEYGSAILDEHVSGLGRLVEMSPALRDGRGTALAIRLILAKTLERLSWRRQRKDFVQPNPQNPEDYLYRISLLKKELQRALYVDSRASNSDPFFTNGAAMVAAGTAATWGTLAQVPLLGTNLLSAQGMALLGGAVGAYIMKDRIKDLLKVHLTKRFRRWDFSHRITGAAIADAGLGGLRGRTRERLQKISETQIPDMVMDLRQRRRTVAGATTELENVLHYRRKATLGASKDRSLPPGHALQDILRISLDDMVRRLDEPFEQVTYYDPKQRRFMCDPLPKVYHLNIVLVSHTKSGAKGQRVRVVLSRNGIVRLEHVKA